MNYLKIVSKGFETYTGALGQVEFENGVSKYPVPTVFANRISAAMRMVEVDGEGNELGSAGVAHKLIADANMRAPKLDLLKRQSDEDKKAEHLAAMKKAEKPPVDVFYTRAELEEIMTEKGIPGLREIGNKWNVKHRHAVVLMEKILAAQNDFIAARDTKFQGKLADKPSANFAESVAKAAIKLKTVLEAAAATGDLAAAINQVKTAEMLLGSNVLASTYEINGETVQLGAIVQSAFERFGGTVEAWNALPDADREDLLRLDLDSRLPKE